MFILINECTVSQQGRLMLHESIFGFLISFWNEIRVEGSDGKKTCLNCVAAAVGWWVELRTPACVHLGMFSATSQGKVWR